MKLDKIGAELTAMIDQMEKEKRETRECINADLAKLNEVNERLEAAQDVTEFQKLYSEAAMIKAEIEFYRRKSFKCPISAEEIQEYKDMITREHEAAYQETMKKARACFADLVKIIDEFNLKVDEWNAVHILLHELGGDPKDRPESIAYFQNTLWGGSGLELETFCSYFRDRKCEDVMHSFYIPS